MEDGLRKLDEGPFNQYIPELNWSSIDAQLGLPLAYGYLVPPNHGSQILPKEPKNAQEDTLSRVLQLLEVSINDFDAAQPLTVYGLDSISAASLSSMLRPHASFSQMQLLGGATWSEIAHELESTSLVDDSSASMATDILLGVVGISPNDFSADIPLSSYGLDSLGAAQLATALQPFITVTQMQLLGQTTWTQLLQSVDSPRTNPFEQVLVEISGGGGIPLIILPGANGSLVPFFGLRKHSSGPIWGIQITDSTPLQSLTGLVDFWKQHIREKRPHGPYRFAAYSASALAGVVLTKSMEDAGEEVSQLAFIDHCPALWIREEAEALLRQGTVENFQNLADKAVLDMLRDDPSTGVEAVSNYEAAVLDDPDAAANLRREVQISRTVMGLIYRFLETFYPATSMKSYGAFIGPFTTWLFSINAPLTILVAEHGVVLSVPGGAWPDLGASRFEKPPVVHCLRGIGHFGLFADASVAQMLEV